MKTDVVVMGDGLAGLASALTLGRAGRRVTVVAPDREPAEVGESLEFSALAFLRALDLDAAELIDLGLAHPKRNVIVELSDAPSFEIWPPGWFCRPPFWCSGEALHIDRSGLCRLLRARAAAEGVEFVSARVTRIETDPGEPDRVSAIVTDGGERHAPEFVVDASGRHARLLGRALSIGREVGAARWSARHERRREDHGLDVTTLRFSSNRRRHLWWEWTIPLGPDRVSVGRCTRHAGQRSGTDTGRTPASEAPGASGLDVDTWRCHVHARTAGANWAMVGDAAVCVDPVTSGGVALALRSAATAARLADAPRCRHARALHEQGTVRLGRMVNAATDGILHRPGLRQLIGLRLTIFVFAGTTLIARAWFVRIATRGRVGLAVHRVLLAVGSGLSRTLGALPARADRLEDGAVPVAPRLPLLVPEPAGAHDPSVS